MEATIIIPVWNGEQVILDCLSAVFAHSGDRLFQVICVDNASHDRSVHLIEENYPQVAVSQQVVNLGFAGGVNVGLRAAKGDLIVLLNQDCMVQPGWLDALLAAVAASPSFGIVGARILNADGSVNHTGAQLERPLALGRHHTDEKEKPAAVEYVTGAVFGITRNTLDRVGLFDDGYYPAYYEEVDYCLRANRFGIETGYVPDATAVHLLSSDEWQISPIQHAANQHAMRYRFVCKQFAPVEFDAFFAAEKAAVAGEEYFIQTLGRLLAARQTLQNMPNIVEKRQHDLDNTLPPDAQRHLIVGFTQIMHQALVISKKFDLRRTPESPALLDNMWQETRSRMQALQRQEYALLEQIYFIEPGAHLAESTWRRFYRLLVLRPLSFISGRDYALRAQLNTIRMDRFEQMTKMQHLIERRLTVLETLTKYEFR